MSKPTLYLMLGYPGSGKTTVSRLIHKLTGAIHLWADHERHKMFKTPTHKHEENLALYKVLNQQTDDLLAESKSVVFDTNFNFYKDRQHMRDIANKNNADIKLIWVTTPRQVAKQRATLESHGKETRVWGNMLESEFERMSNNLQPPRNDESYIEIDGTNVTPEYVKQQLNL